MEETKKCSKCGGHMIKGYFEAASTGITNGKVRWIEDTVTKKYLDIDERATQVYRCEKCGFLESYAK